jgi:nicotinamidase-related amidase
MSVSILLIIDPQQEFTRQDCVKKKIKYINSLIKSKKYQIKIATQDLTVKKGYDFDPGLDLKNVDIIIRKKYFDAGKKTKLYEIIGNSSVVHVAGCNTDECVVATVQGLIDHGFAVRVLEDGCWASSTVKHRLGLEQISKLANYRFCKHYNNTKDKKLCKFQEY